MMLFNKISAEAKKTISSLTGFSPDNPAVFNQWWQGRRYSFKIKERTKEEDKEIPKEDNKEPPLELKIKMPPNPNEQFWKNL